MHCRMLLPRVSMVTLLQRHACHTVLPTAVALSAELRIIHRHPWLDSRGHTVVRWAQPVCACDRRLLKLCPVLRCSKRIIVHRDLKPANLMLGGIPHETGTREMAAREVSSLEAASHIELR